MAVQVDLVKLRALFDQGLSEGVENGLGQVCVEAAIALASGEELSDTPSCVAEPDRQWSIYLNDLWYWNPSTRAEVLWPVAMAQLGTAGTDRGPWLQKLALGILREALPFVLARVAGMEPYAKRFAAARTLADAYEVARQAHNAATELHWAAQTCAAFGRCSPDADSQSLDEDHRIAQLVTLQLLLNEVRPHLAVKPYEKISDGLFAVLSRIDLDDDEYTTSTELARLLVRVTVDAYEAA